MTTGGPKKGALWMKEDELENECTIVSQPHPIPYGTVCAGSGSSAPSCWMLLLCKGMGEAGDGPSCLVHVHAYHCSSVSLCLCTRVHGEGRGRG